MRDNRVELIERMLTSGTDADVTYAALECRLAIEQIVQEKLKLYESRHGTKLLHKHWQPSKSLKILCQLEPSADRSHTLSISKEDDSGNPTTWSLVGKHEALTKKWISKHYQKLGSYLHVSSVSRNRGETIDYLRLVLTELKRVDSSNLASTLAHLINFECRECSATIACNAEAISELERVVCPTDTCVAEYIPVERNAGEWEFAIDKVPFKCLSCQVEMWFYTPQLSEGFGFQCKGCKQKHVIDSRPWSYRTV